MKINADPQYDLLIKDLTNTTLLKGCIGVGCMVGLGGYLGYLKAKKKKIGKKEAYIILGTSTASTMFFIGAQRAETVKRCTRLIQDLDVPDDWVPPEKY